MARRQHPLDRPARALGIVVSDTTGAARIRQTSAIITRQVRHMTELVDDLLDVSRVTRGLVKLDTTTLDAKKSSPTRSSRSAR